MIAYGAEITDAQTEIITTYLAKNYGKDAIGANKIDLSHPRR